MSIYYWEVLESEPVNVMEWFQTASEEEKRLADSVARLEPLFDDMRIHPGTIADTLIVTSYINPDTNKEYEDYYDVPDLFDIKLIRTKRGFFIDSADSEVKS